MRSLLGALVALAAIIAIPATARAQSGDTVWVRTLSFDSITARRGTWAFPGGSESYRKILMYHTLKCDVRTTQDKYPCGEWDYLTYTKVYSHTGRIDSTLLTAPLFRVGADAPDSIAFTTKPTRSIHQRWAYTLTIDSVLSERAYALRSGTESIGLAKTPGRIQFVIPKEELKEAGMSGSTPLGALRLDMQGAGSTLRNFTVRMRMAPSVPAAGFENGNLVSVIHRDLAVRSAGPQTIPFDTSFTWSGINDLLVDISYDGIDGDASLALAGHGGMGIGSASGNSYLSFDGTSDYVDAGTIPELSGARAATYEAWLRVDTWQGSNKVLGAGDRFHIELGREGEIHCMVRNPDNSYGSAANAIKARAWYHIAMVYDGNQPDNAGRLKLYINGRQTNLSFTGQIPATAEVNDAPFTLTDLAWGAASLDGALDEVRVWSAALDAATIQSWYTRSITASHPNYGSLLAYYPLGEGSGGTASDGSGHGHDGRLLGAPAWKQSAGEEMVIDPAQLTAVPNLTLLKGSYRTHKDSTLVSEQAQDPPVTIATYEVKDYQPVIRSVRYVWRSGYQYTYDPSGKAIDSTPVAAEVIEHNGTLSYYGRPFEVLVPWEIGRFITPYGINLDLGPQGFTWVYDVTDYAPLLRGQVDLSSGNQQELIDLRFAFIKGDPPREVLRIDRIWPDNTETNYRALSDNTMLRDTMMHLLPEAEQFMVRTRLTGHGHESNNGEYPHCCEWKDNVHFLMANDTAFAWHIFQYNDCALNPVYPQGGTWPGSREGWCPGDIVKVHDFEITDHVAGDSVRLDYDISKVPADNAGMGNGNYVVTMHLFEYGPPTHPVDVEVYDVTAPTNVPYYSRANPVCAPPIALVRNNGAAPVTSINFTYGVSGGTQEHHAWRGTIAPNTVDTITLPISGSSFWMGDGTSRFTVAASDPNGAEDQYHANDAFTTSFSMPDLYAGRMVLWYKTNKRAADYRLEVRDIGNRVVYGRAAPANETLYRDTLDLPAGCYTLRLEDPENMGLSYWAYPDQGSGYLRIYSDAGKMLKSFNADFGNGITYSFSLGGVAHVADENASSAVSIFPNPAKFRVRIVIDDLPMGAATLRVFDYTGRLLHTEQVEVGEHFSTEVDTKELPGGSYFVTIENDARKLTKRFIKR